MDLRTRLTGPELGAAATTASAAVRPLFSKSPTVVMRELVYQDLLYEFFMRFLKTISRVNWTKNYTKWVSLVGTDFKITIIKFRY
jgi:hypothetical protein